MVVGGHVMWKPFVISSLPPTKHGSGHVELRFRPREVGVSARCSTASPTWS